MKRLAVSIILLTVTVTVAVFSQILTASSLKKLELTFSELSAACEENDYEVMEKTAEKAVGQWEKTDLLLELFVSNNDIEALEQQILIIGQSGAGNTDLIKHHCALAAALTKQILEFEKITIKNIF